MAWIKLNASEWNKSHDQQVEFNILSNWGLVALQGTLLSLSPTFLPSQSV